jgi:hypothetical protein
MDSNTHSTQPPQRSGRLAALAAANQGLADQDLDQLADPALADDLLELRQLLDGLEGQWLRRLATIDARGAAGADQGQAAPSTAAWLRNRRRLSVEAARSNVRTARALFSGALPETAAALCAGEISPAHAKMIADGTRALPDHIKLDAEPVLLDIARRVDPPQLRQAVEYLCRVADPDRADRHAARRHERRGVWMSPTWDGMVAIDGLLEAEAGTTLLAALEPLARPADAHDVRSGCQRNADALTELARRSLEGGWLPKAGGVRPQLLITVDLDSLQAHPDSLGGETGWAGRLDPEACLRLACDGSVTRVLVRRHPGQPPTAGGSLDNAPGVGADPATDHDSSADHAPSGDHDPGALAPPAVRDLPEEVGLTQRLRAAAAKLPPVLGGAPRQPLEVGRATRVVQPPQRSALAVRDGGCVFPDCDRPLAWCDAHHLWHWVHGGRTDLDNLALLCRAHHRKVHEGGWRLLRGPDGRFSAAPPDRSRRHRRHHAACPEPERRGRPMLSNAPDEGTALGRSATPSPATDGARTHPDHRARQLHGPDGRSP